ncbi:MAG: hypothetical protein ACLVBJ_08975 [Pilosibacter sp.]
MKKKTMIPTDYLYADIVNIDQFEPIGEVEYFFYGKVLKLPYEELQEIVEVPPGGMEWGNLSCFIRTRRESFRCSLNTSHESIMASGDSLSRWI